MQHPEVDYKQDVIGWQPVYSTSRQPKSQAGSTSFLLWRVCIAVTVLALGASGGLLWNKAQTTDAEVDAKIQQALFNDRARITECIAQTEQTKKAPQTGHAKHR